MVFVCTPSRMQVSDRFLLKLLLPLYYKSNFPIRMLWTCSGHALGMLWAYSGHAPGMPRFQHIFGTLSAHDQHAISILSACNQHIISLLLTVYRHAINTLSRLSELAISTLSAHSGHATGMLPAHFHHAIDTPATCYQPCHWQSNIILQRSKAPRPRRVSRSVLNFLHPGHPRPDHAWTNANQ